MGMFSFKTADTKTSIPCVAGFESPTVYLLQPGGMPPIAEDAYAGDGCFDGRSCFDWLARHNLSNETLLKAKNQQEIETLGIGLSCGQYYRYRSTGEYWTVFHDYSLLLNKGRHFDGFYDDVIPELNASANELIACGDFVPQKFSERVLFPLKFSFNPNAIYEDLDASESCEFQGFLYDEKTKYELINVFKNLKQTSREMAL
jgi:hypothetical protein